IGGAFVIDGDKRIELPVTRGVSAIAVGNLDGRPGDEIVVGDGWHSDYGKIARCRIAVVSRQGNDWKYDLIEDLEDHLRFERIDLVDLNADGKPEVVAWASTNGVLGGTVRVYQREAGGWQGMTAGPDAQTYGAGDFNGDKKPELVFAGQPPMPFALASAAPRWDAKLGAALETREVDPKSLIGQPAPELKATEWVGSDPQTLASLKGKVVMLDYWATWCKPCLEMYPEMRTWVEESGPKGFVVLGITNHSQQTSALIRRFHARQKLPWAVAIDPKNGTHRDYGVSPIPHTFLIDRQGVVRLEHRGGGDLTTVKAKLEELLAEKPKGTK
ncbi:MAG: redoxin domain-containing protein, partial [Acidobacteria bacterium]|nr:redoxin domain-containing protein [Acidobacteriota bacterium]